MLRISLAFLSVALLFASTARAQVRGGGGGTGAMAMSGMGAGGCASGSSTAGAASSHRGTAAGSSIATGFGANPAATYLRHGKHPDRLDGRCGDGTGAATAAAFYGVGGYGVTAGSNPYAQRSTTPTEAPMAASERCTA